MGLLPRKRVEVFRYHKDIPSKEINLSNIKFKLKAYHLSEFDVFYESNDLMFVPFAGGFHNSWMRRVGVYLFTSQFLDMIRRGLTLNLNCTIAFIVTT
jgi:hypothetical protein